MGKKIGKIRPLLMLILILSLILTATPYYHTIKTEAKESSVKANYIIVAKNQKGINKVNKDYKEDVEENFEEYDSCSENILTAELTKEQAENIADDSDIAYVEKDVCVSADSNKNKAKKSIKGNKKWNLDSIHSESYRNEKVTEDAKVKVAVLDSGIDISCELPIYKSTNLVPGEENLSLLFEDITGHGTGVLGVIAANDKEQNVYGVNPNVKLYTAKVLDEKNQSPVSRVVEGIYWAIDQDVDIINLSLGTTTDSQLLHQAIIDAANHGILIIAAAGNGGAVHYPAAYDEVVAVGSLNANGDVSSFSSIGEEVELVAPGEEIVTAGVFDGVTTAEGTSVAAPHVTGVASLIMQKENTRDAKLVRNLLCETANDLNEGKKSGYGLVDADYAIKNYDKYEKAYYAGEKETVSKNTKAVNAYEDIDVIEGKWTQTLHNTTINNAGASLNYVEATIMRLGSKYADDSSIGFKGMTVYPYFHGYFATDSVSCANNYIASYIFLTRMAQSGVDSASTSGLTSVTGYSSYATMKSKLKTILANKTVYGGESVTAANKRYFLWGMAMHSAADSFAHCAYIKSGSTYVHILHADGADDNGVYPSRFTAAKKVVSNVIARYISSTTASSSGERTPISGKAGTYSEYVLADSYFKDNGVFSYRLRHLTKFMTEVGNTNTSVFANQSY